MVTPTSCILGEIKYATEVRKAFPECNPATVAIIKTNGWLKPVAGKLKLNTDASLYPGMGGAGFGGIIRDGNGRHILSFSGKSGDTMVLQAEIYGIYKGLSILYANNYSKMEVDTDSLDAVRMINNEDEFNSSRFNLIPEIRRLLQLTVSNVRHISREQNKCADTLARMGSFQIQYLLVYNSPHDEIKETLLEDITGGKEE